jgi:hypothetical protein
MFLGFLQKSKVFGSLLTLAIQLGFELTNTGSLISLGGTARFQIGLCGIALGSKALDGSGTLGSNGFESGASSGNSLGFGELSPGGSKSVGGFAVTLLEQGLF